MGIIIISLVLTVAIVVSIVYTIKFYECRNALESAEYDLDRLTARYKELVDAVPSPVCLCGHGVNLHDDESRKCGHSSYNGATTFFGWEVATKCQCKRYVGPEPVPTFYHPELL